MSPCEGFSQADAHILPEQHRLSTLPSPEEALVINTSCSLCRDVMNLDQKTSIIQGYNAQKKKKLSCVLMPHMLKVKSTSINSAFQQHHCWGLDVPTTTLKHRQVLVARKSFWPSFRVILHTVSLSRTSAACVWAQHCFLGDWLSEWVSEKKWRVGSGAMYKWHFRQCLVPCISCHPIAHFNILHCYNLELKWF